MPQTCGGAAREGPPRNDRSPSKDHEPRSAFTVARDADQPQDHLEDQGDDLVGEAIDLIVAGARPLSPGQREALRRRILGGGAR
jgi:hypothetical protein